MLLSRRTAPRFGKSTADVRRRRYCPPGRGVKGTLPPPVRSSAGAERARVRPPPPRPLHPPTGAGREVGRSIPPRPRAPQGERGVRVAGIPQGRPGPSRLWRAATSAQKLSEPPLREAKSGGEFFGARAISAALRCAHVGRTEDAADAEPRARQGAGRAAPRGCPLTLPSPPVGERESVQNGKPIDPAGARER
jgi:hypothetical protein